MKEILEIVRIFAAPVIGLIGVWLGSRLKQKSDIKVQKEFLLREIKIKNLQEVSQDLSDLIREVVSPFGLIFKLTKNKIALGEFQQGNDLHQERTTKLYRGIKVKILFLDEDYKNNIEIFYDKYLLLADKIYEGYYQFQDIEPQNRKYSIDEVSFDAIRMDIDDAASFGYNILESLNKDLIEELGKLK
ncbi:hypothetical protein ACN6MY_03640 [Peribacillus sp. B-H-3]|uniref:hypothetical protein n=1 Tax=Peribacillus sp. B-H-3 TaxID=3400420 RepID=UPI003B01E359